MRLHDLFRVSGLGATHGSIATHCPCAILCFAILAICLATPAVAQNKPSAGMMRYPDISAEQIVFSYAGDLWIADRDGGMATPLASPAGSELFPRFSDDGKQIAFVGNYDGDVDIYTISNTGGNAKRMTYHPANELLCDWTPDGDLLFSSSGFSGLRRQSQLFVLDEDKPLPKQLPVPYGTNGTISDDGQWLAYTPHSRDSRTWKRYRGGMASDIWLFNLKTKKSRRVTDWEGTDTIPMWHGETVYYLSDAGKQQRLNIWAYNTKTKKKTQITKFEEFDCKWPAIGPGEDGDGDGEIILQNGSELHVVNLKTKKTKSVEITVPGDRLNLRKQEIDASKFINSGDISPSAKRIVVEARGDIWTLPAKKGAPRNLTNTNGVAERMPEWSPDGQWIAYFADESGEYELYIKQSDGRGETKQLTDDGKAYRYSPNWSPDSKQIMFTDNTGEIFLHNIESGKTKSVDKNPVPEQRDANWSHDSKWIVYAKSVGTRAMTSTVWVYNVADESKQQITNSYFDCDDATFGRDGDYIFCKSNRSFKNPQYEDVGESFIYRNTEVLLAIPLRSDVKLPLLPESDEEKWKDKDEDDEDDDDMDDDDEDKEDKNDDDADDEDEDDEDSDDEKEKDSDDEDSDDEDTDDDENADQNDDDPVTGSWSGEIESDDVPEGEGQFTFVLKLEDGKVTGEIQTPEVTLEITSGSFDEKTGNLKLTAETDDISVTVEGKIDSGSFSGTAVVPGLGELPINATREASDDDDDDKKKGDKKKDKIKPVKIEFEGIAERIFQLPVSAGNFAGLMVNDKNHLVYARVTRGARGEGGGAGLKIFDIEDEKKAEKKIVDGISQYAMTADGKKLFVQSGEKMYIIKAAAGQSLADKISTKGMNVMIDPRVEWKQIFVDAWRIEREFFYDPTMHGHDWDEIRKQYEPMIDDATSRSDVGFVIGEMIAELNVGHAYYRGTKDPNAPKEVPVGLLGCKFEVSKNRYKIGTMFEGAPWDTDAKNPLRAFGLKEGDFILAVNGMELKADSSPYAAFQGLADAIVSLTVSDDAKLDDEDKQVLVKPMATDNNLRFRHWIEQNRKYVDEQSDGRVGYIYVTDTGQSGQNDLVRQFYGQLDKDALIIDDRWNGGGQIPTRFIELLNRPVTNYWAKRHGVDWTWPPDSHQGPKCMLINGMAGSGGDMFPALFKQNELGKLIGMRTWGGLVGISGGPDMVDGSNVTAPSFAFYETDGTWGIEGHGVDPDIEVIDDPAKMQGGKDPQLKAGIEQMLKELKKSGYKKPDRPAYPNRRKIGIEESDK